MHLFVATELDPGEASPEDGEDLELVRVPAAGLPALLAELDDAKTLVGLLTYLRLSGGG
jgi:hypothetical protein